MKGKIKKSKVWAVLLSALMLGALFTGCNDDNSSQNASSAAEESTSAVTTAAAPAVTTVTEQKAPESKPDEAAHTSPTEKVTFSMGSEKSDINKVMDYDDEVNKLYKANISDFVRDAGDRIDSFVFVFRAENSDASIGVYKGGVGISVNDNCDAATDPGWFQSLDFSENEIYSSYHEVVWQVPEEIKDYVATSGGVQIGYWWGQQQRLILDKIICNYTATAEIPVDGTNTVDVNKSVSCKNETDKTIKVPLSSLIPADGVPRYFEFDVEGGQTLEKYIGAFGISVDDSCPVKTDPSWFQSKNVAVMTNSNSAKLYWLVPDSITDYIKSDGEVMLGYWWSQNDSITLKNITVKYSSKSGAAPAPSEPAETKPDNSGNSDSSGAKSSAEIVKDMKIGWNLGNTLDCSSYTDYATDGETAWGNPKTTKAMIDAVKAEGFNAVRVPVTWTNHINGDTIDSAWMNRVKEIVDYVIDNGMYCIINVHHDSDCDKENERWLVPSKAREAEVTAKYVKVWQQIAEKFKGYDYHLLFEGLNEPRIVGGQDEWAQGTEEEREVINNLLGKFVETVRKSGGNNSTRTLILTGHAAAMNETAIRAIKIPNDDHVIVSIHAYSPYFFAMAPDGPSTFDDSMKSELDANFDLIKSVFIDKGVPAIIGEFGSVNKNNDSERVKHIEYYVKAAKQRGITCFLWDNNVKTNSKGTPEETFGYLNRSDCSWYFKSVVDAAVKAAK